MEKRSLVAWCGLLLSSNHLAGKVSSYVISGKALRFFGISVLVLIRYHI